MKFKYINIANFDGKSLEYLVWLGCEPDNPFQRSVDDKNAWIHTSKSRYETKWLVQGQKMRNSEKQGR